MSEWKPIETAPCDDTMALVYYVSGIMAVEDLDHDSDPEWWAVRGASHWMPLPAPPEQARPPRCRRLVCGLYEVVTEPPAYPQIWACANADCERAIRAYGKEPAP